MILTVYNTFALQHFYMNNSEILFIMTNEDLSFPLNLAPVLKMVISIGLVVVLGVGLGLRSAILCYFKGEDSKRNHLDYLLWIDQVSITKNTCLKHKSMIQDIFSVIIN